MAKAALPDLVVIDAELRDTAPMVVCERIRSEPLTQAIPIIVTSKGPMTHEEKAAAFEAGADACLSAVHEGIELAALIRGFLRGRGPGARPAIQADEVREKDRRKNELFATLAHELRNPLGAVTAGLSLLGSGGQLCERDQKVIANVERQSKHLARRIEDLLDVSRLAYGNVGMTRERLELGDVLSNAVEAARPSFERHHVRLDFLPSRLLVPIEGDATRLEQVVASLLDNALKYTPDGGTVTVSVEMKDTEAGRAGLFRVRDTGAGITRENLDDLIQIFGQGEASRTTRQAGLGLGLTLVRRLVELHGGTVSVRSDGAGLGAELAVELPLWEEAPAQGPPSHTRSSPPSQRRRVLLVDDNEDSCFLFEMALVTHGHSVDTAFTGTDGLEQLLAGDYDVAVIDIGLPGLDGYEVARRARAELGDRTPLLVAVTGYGREEDRASSHDAGFAIHLVKPVDVNVLVSTLGAELSSLTAAK